jgi:hypothetical protein
MARLEVAQVLHGALHSGNIYLSHNSHPILTDWGLARDYSYFDEDEANDDLSWIAPELLLTGHANYNSDVYSYGVLLFEMLEGWRPFSSLTNRELLFGYRSGLLGDFPFDQTPPAFRSLINQCTNPDPDMRPSFCELYSLFQSGALLFPEAAAADARLVLAHYPMSAIFDPAAYLTGLPADDRPPQSDWVAVLADPTNGRFAETVEALSLSIAPDSVSEFCAALAPHASSPDPGPLLSALRTLSARGQYFAVQVLQSDFFRHLRVTPDHADAALELVTPAFTAAPDLFKPCLFHTVAQLFIFRPAVMLSVIPAQTNAARLFLSLWQLFFESSLAGHFICRLAALLLSAPDFWESEHRAITGVASHFLNGTEPSGILAAALLLARVAPDSLLLTAASTASLARCAPSPNALATIVLAARSLPASPDLTRLLIARASDDRTTAALFHYARASPDHAATLLAVDDWARPTALGCRLMLIVFAHAHLRERLSQMPAFPAILNGFCDGSRTDLMRAACSLVQRLPLDAALLQRLSRAGFFQNYIATTLGSGDLAAILCGVILLDVSARVGYIDEWTEATEALVDLFEARFDQLADDLIVVFTTMSAHPGPMAVMRERGIVEYFQGLLAYEPYRQHATSFLANAGGG